MLLHEDGTMRRLTFRPIQGKSLDIIDAILQTEEVASVDDFWSKLSVVVEELVVNIVDYSQSDYIDVEIMRDDKSLTLRFHDGGMPFNPLEREFPDFSIPMEDRQIGGLGIFLVTKYMDTVTYEHTGGENILTVTKGLKNQTTMSFTEEEFLKIKAEKERMEAELRQASELQQSMVPNGYFTQDNLEVFGKLIPARQMGGDLYDYAIIDGKLYFCIGDVCGKGAPAAMLMAYAHAHLGELAFRESNPASIIYALNKMASYQNESCTFFTLFLGVLDLQTGRLQYCNAGHNPPYILTDEVKMLDCDPNPPVGPMEDAEFSLQETTLSPGSTILLYTDGLTEAKAAGEEELGQKRTEEVLKECIEQRLNPEEIVNRLIEAVHDFAKNVEQSDDLTMLAVRYTAPAH